MPNALLQYQPITSSIFILLRLQLRSPPIRSRKHLDHVTRPSQKILFSDRVAVFGERRGPTDVVVVERGAASETKSQTRLSVPRNRIIDGLGCRLGLDHPPFKAEQRVMKKGRE
ncbi:hypothetical protein MTP99_000222 [Tenebrio molitor]|jgi:hypothetical protein|nr:hypothetical protein MTP99_000222 [Tenebrio molitor]